MSNNGKTIQELLSKLNIEQLNPMQVATKEAIIMENEVVLLSPTGSGKTVAFLLPLIDLLHQNVDNIQALILVPSRELAIQIEQVLHEMGSGYKINAVYGGRSGSSDKLLLATPPAILIGTPGRVADHVRRGHIDTRKIKILVLDEFDKSLESGFENEMSQILTQLTALEKKILTSATQKVKIPAFMGMKSPKRLSFLNERQPSLIFKTVVVLNGDRLKTLALLISYIENKRGIIFCNFKDTINEVGDYLRDHDIKHSTFYGDLEQQDRERELIKFRNGTTSLLVATDLAARGIDVPDLDFIIHYQLPTRKDEFIHRNGRTARMNTKGTVYLLEDKQEQSADFIDASTTLSLDNRKVKAVLSRWETLHLSGGRRDKISKGDIAGLFFKQGNLQSHELGIIETHRDSAYVAVPHEKAHELINNLNNSRIKKRKLRITLLK